jgi:predicted CxxxxCH...CXXCH cytochrome family protein
MVPGAGQQITFYNRHIDGNVDVNDNAACDSCHGSGGESAPPVDVSGSSSTSSRGVGAHRSHLGTSSWHKDIQCTECHTVPTSTTSVGHLDSPLPAELTWGTLAQNTQWDGVACSNNYCHGSTLSGGTVTSPRWTDVSGSASQCGSCHGAPPPPPHTTNTNCGACHQSMTGATDLTITDPSLHINGSVEVVDGGACNSCHGSSTSNAPPADTQGNSATSFRGVGSHQSHLGPSSWYKEIQCSECHQVPGSVNALGHIDTALPAELTFGALAGSPSATYSYSTTTCSNNYCHGNGRGNNGTAQWTMSMSMQCNSCHPNSTRNLPDAHRKHEDESCSDCHATVANGNTIIIGPNLHIDGQTSVAFGSSVTWDPATKRCSGSCHGRNHNNNPW